MAAKKTVSIPLAAIPIGSWSKKFPTLYQRTKTGAIQQWTISCGDTVQFGPDAKGPLANIRTEWGQVDGKLQITMDIVSAGKNLGKKNETSIREQAEAEAFALWEKKGGEGYVEDIEMAKAGKVNIARVLGGIEPMLAPNKSYPKDPDLVKRIKFPCYDQRKLDGQRCTSQMIDGGDVTLWTRQRKPILSVPHIVVAIKKRFPNGTLRLDGELYSHEYRKNFEDLMGVIREDGPDEAGEYLKAEFHCYDLPECNIPGFPVVTNETPLDQRLAVLGQLLKEVEAPLVLVETRVAHNMAELLEHFEVDIADEYEGTMAKNMGAKYKPGSRNPDTQKMKLFEDHEFKVIGVNEGRGKDIGTAATFTIQLPCLCHGKGDPEKEARARLKTKYAVRRDFFQHPEKAIGKILTVTMKRWTNYNAPYIPVAKLPFRDGGE
jgi:ATP-dependent DNA ligase